MNEVEAAQDLFDSIVPPAALQDEEENLTALDIEDKLKSLEGKYARFCRIVSQRPKDQAKSIMSESAKKGQQETILQFQKEASLQKKCENCDAVSPAYRKDGYNKIFRKPMSMRMQQQMASSKRKMTSALEKAKAPLRKQADSGDDEMAVEINSDEEDAAEESEDEDDDVGGAAAPMNRNRKLAKDEKEPDKVVAPNEVQAVIKALWASNTELLHFIWGRPYRSLHYSPSAASDRDAANGYRVFFTQCLLVPANRFRPEAHVGERATESPQNTYLSKIIILNDDISKLVRESKLAKIAKEAAGSEDGSDDGDSKSGNEEDQAADATKKVVASNLSRIMGAWIQLQDAVNCYMDNAKDPNPLNSGRLAAGIRQVLERKEGMFRMNMMGKRVNFCCRSVISPDPYIGTNEIGIPKHFAMALHYPEPVNGFNVKHLRTLVERGPDQYPGSYLLSCSCPPR